MQILSKISIALFIIISITGNYSYSQQDPQYSMYMFNPLSSNPAYAGSRDALSVTLLGRTQWVGFDGAPQTGSLTIHTPLKNENIAVGLSITYDEIGPTKNNMIYADVAYRFQVSPSSKLSFGLKGGIDIYSANFNGLIVNNNTDILYTTPISSKLMPNAGFGAYWYSTESYVGLTAPRLIENTFGLSGVGSGEQAKQNRHFFLMAGHTFRLSSTIDLIPSAVVKAVQDAPLSLDVNINLFFYERFWVGAGYRVGDAAIANIMYHFSSKFRAGYAYDFTLSVLGGYNTGSHEIMLNYDLDFLGKGFKTPRRF
jgi:type IX secretion system PorP/SprF family membrane protein